MNIIFRPEIRLSQRVHRDMSNPFHMTNETFNNTFRFNKDVAQLIINLIEPHLRAEEGNTSIPTHLKILATLRFYATGCYQINPAEGCNFAFSQLIMSRSLDEV